MPIKMGKNNGYPGKIILGIITLKELMAIGKIGGAGKVIQDGKLVADTGFNIEKIKNVDSGETWAFFLSPYRRKPH